MLSFIKSTSTAQYDEEMIAEMERRAVAEKGSKKAATMTETAAVHWTPCLSRPLSALLSRTGQHQPFAAPLQAGYARAARIMDQMEQEKIIGPMRCQAPPPCLLTKARVGGAQAERPV